MQEHQQGASNVVSLRAATTTPCAASGDAEEFALPPLPQRPSGMDQWQPLGVVVRRLMARMLVEQQGGPYG